GGQTGSFTALTVVAVPMWGVHCWFAQRLAFHVPFERGSALRRLYLYRTCLVASLATMYARTFALGRLLQPAFDGLDFNALVTSQLGWATVVFAGVLAFHFTIALRDRAAIGEEGTSSTLRRWYMYIALLVGLLTMLA